MASSRPHVPIVSTPETLVQRFGQLGEVFRHTDAFLFGSDYRITKAAMFEFLANEEIERLPLIRDILDMAAKRSPHELRTHQITNLFEALVCIGVIDKDLLEYISKCVQKMDFTVPDIVSASGPQKRPELLHMTTSVAAVLSVAGVVDSLEKKKEIMHRKIDAEKHERAPGAELCEKVVQAFRRTMQAGSRTTPKELNLAILSAANQGAQGVMPINLPLNRLHTALSKTIQELFTPSEKSDSLNHTRVYQATDRAMDLLEKDQDFMDKLTLATNLKSLQEIERICNVVLLDPRQ